MKHLICRVEKFEIIAPFMLRVTFDDATEQVVDLEPVLRGELFGALRNPAVFHQVTLDPDVGTLVWPNGADFDPATLHDWPECRDAFIEMAKKWDSAMVQSLV